MTEPTGRPKGRPPGPKTQYLAEVGKARQRLATNLDAIAARHVDLALGTRILLIRNPQTGEYERPRTVKQAKAAMKLGHAVQVYVQEPDLRAILAAEDRIMGKIPVAVDDTFRVIVAEALDAQETLSRLVEERVPANLLASNLADLRGVREQISRTRATLDATDTQLHA